MERPHQVAPIGLAEREAVQEPLLPEGLEASPRLAHGNVENEPPDPGALCDPPWSQTGRIVPIGLLCSVGQSLPGTASVSYGCPVGGELAGQYPSDCKTGVAVDPSLALLQVHGITRQVPVRDLGTPCVEIQSLLSDGRGGEHMGPERAVECAADCLGMDGRLLSLVRARPVAANRLIEGERGMGAKMVVRAAAFETGVDLKWTLRSLGLPQNLWVEAKE